MDTTTSDLRADALRLIDEINLISRELDGFSRGELLYAVQESANSIGALQKLIDDDSLPIRGIATEKEKELRFVFDMADRFSEGEILQELTAAQSVLRRLISATVAA